MKKVLGLILILIFLCPNAMAKKTASTATPTGNGYAGSLPNLEEHFKSYQHEEAQSSFEYKDGFNDPDVIKPAPRDNPAFVNIILKKDKTSQYVNDLNSLIAIIEKLQTVIEEDQDIQKFNAQSYFFKLNAEFFRDKYKNKAEQSYVSFRKVMQLNTHVQSVAQLRVQSETYSPFVTAQNSGNAFSQNNINNQLDYLLDEIKQTLVVLKETK